jgi:hypothetical protein
MSASSERAIRARAVPPPYLASTSTSPMTAHAEMDRPLADALGVAFDRAIEERPGADQDLAAAATAYVRDLRAQGLQAEQILPRLRSTLFSRRVHGGAVAASTRRVNHAFSRVLLAYLDAYYRVG